MPPITSTTAKYVAQPLRRYRKNRYETTSNITFPYRTTDDRRTSRPTRRGRAHLQVPQYGVRRAVPAHPVDATAGRCGGRAQVEPGCPRPVRVPARRRSKERLAQRPGAAGDVPTEVVRVVAFAVGRRRRDAREDLIAKSRGEALDLSSRFARSCRRLTRWARDSRPTASAARSAHACHPPRSPVRRCKTASPSGGPARRPSPTKRPHRRCRPRAPSRRAERHSALHGTGPARAQSTLKTPGPR